MTDKAIEAPTEAQIQAALIDIGTCVRCAGYMPFDKNHALDVIRAALEAKAEPVVSCDAVAAMERAKKLPIWDGGVPHELHRELDIIFRHLSAPPTTAEVKAQALERDLLIFENARRLINKGMTNWHLYTQIFGVGSNTAFRRCVDMGIDPDAFTAKRLREEG
jgi:hypothetical protein